MAAEPRTGRIESIADHGTDTRSLFLRLDAPLPFRPGQFISCLLPVDGEAIRPYSIASSPEDTDRLELLFNLVPGGTVSRHLFGLTPGATIRFTGPWGTFVCDQAPDAEAVFIAEGAGIAPIRPMIHRVLHTGHDHPVRLLHATDHPLYAAELDALSAAHPRLSVTRVPAGTLEREVRRRWVDADADRSRHFFICGVGPIVPALRDLLRHAGYERRAVQYEKW